LFWVPSTLNSFYGSSSCLISSCRLFAYWRFINFSVASESTDVIALALFDFESMKNQMVIDFLLNINTLEVWLCLIKLCENPAVPPSC
jgi:hypothetical protein